MPRTHYADILSNLHVNNDDNIPVANTDTMFKLRHLIEILNQNFSLYYNPSENLSIDENMILFKGRSSLKQYNAKKTIKRGYKLWVRADMDGYVSKFNVYQGKNRKPNLDGVPPGFGLGESVVVEITRDLAGNYHRVFCDNYFTSVPLLEYLLDKKYIGMRNNTTYEGRTPA